MGRRKTASGGLLGILIAAAIVFLLISGTINSISTALPGDMLPAILTIIALGIVIFMVLRFIDRRREARLREAWKQRYQELLGKYQDPAVAEQLMTGGIWHEMSKEQLIDSWGQPDEVETKVMKTKVREIYKFGRVGVNRFSKRVTLENDVVVAWETK